MAKTISKASPPKIEGVKETLKVLNKFDSTLRKQFNNQFKEAVAPTVEAAKANVPSQPPLSGWERNWKGKPLWDGEKEDRRIRLKINTRRVRPKTIERGMVYDNVGAIVVQATGRGLAVFDMAGRRGEPSTVRGDLMVKHLNNRWRKASRAMWPAAEETQDEVTRNCIPIVKRAELEAQRLLARQVINRGR